MKFVHFADSHLDGFKEERLNSLSFENFRRLIDFSLEKKVDFVLLAGDLFNSALPRVDALKETVVSLKRLQEAKIPVYAIPGSHDFSPRGRTMIEVLEKAGLLVNVMKGEVIDGKLHLEYTVDEKTGAYITGIIGKKGMLDKEWYSDVVLPERPKNAFSIFMFHTSISELRPKHLEMMDAYPVSFLPEGFDYYAGGHVHIRERYEGASYRAVVYPGPTFPNSFSELEQLEDGSFVFYNSDSSFEDNNNLPFHFVRLHSKDVRSFSFDLEGVSASAVVDVCSPRLEKEDFSDTIVLLRFSGNLSEGRVQDVDLNSLVRLCYDQGAYLVLRNSYKLVGKSLVDVDSSSELVSDDVELDTAKEFLGQQPLPEGLNEQQLVFDLLRSLDVEPGDGEKKTFFVERVQSLAREILENNNDNNNDNKQ